MTDGAATRDAAYSEWKLLPVRCGVALDLRTVRTHKHKLTIEMTSGEGELYDLHDDPHEMRNLWRDPAHTIERRRLEDLLRARPGKTRANFSEPVGIY
jgi:hypothetical protein